MSDEAAAARVNIRIAVLCERLRVRASHPETQHPASEEQVQEVERRLGFRLPAMLRALYLDVADYGCETPEIIPLSELDAYHTGWRLPPVVVAALRYYPGSYVTWGEVGFPGSGPDGFVHLAMGGGGLIGVMLDVHTGHVFYGDPDSTVDHFPVSFCAPSIEDWLERELDAAPMFGGRYQPRQKLATLLLAEGVGLAELMRLPMVDQPHEAVDAVDKPHEATTRMELDLSAWDAKRETERRREENLGSEGPDRTARHANWERLPRSMLRIAAAGQAIEQARHQLLRQLYTLMDVLEQGQRWAEEYAKGLPPQLRTHHAEQLQLREEMRVIAEKRAIEELRALIIADAELASLAQKISYQGSALFSAAGGS